MGSTGLKDENKNGNDTNKDSSTLVSDEGVPRAENQDPQGSQGKVAPREKTPANDAEGHKAFKFLLHPKSVVQAERR